MAKRKRVRMPSSEGGIVRYFDEEYASKIMLKPIHIVILTVAIAVFFIILAAISG